MKRRAVLAGTPALLGATFWARAGQDATSQQEPLRIGLVDVVRAALKSEKLKAILGPVQGDLGTLEKEILAKQREARTLQDRLARQAAALAPEKADAIRGQIKRLREEIDYLGYKWERTVRKRDRELRKALEPFIDDILQAVQRVAKAHKIDILLPGDLVLYASDRVDLTDRVTREIDRSVAAKTGSTSTPKPPADR